MKRHIYFLIIFLTLSGGKLAAQQPQGSLSANGPFCVSGTGQLKFTSTAGTPPFNIVYNDGVADRTANNVADATFFDVAANPVTSTTTYTLVSVTDEGGAGTTRTGGFTQGTAVITINDLPQGSLSADGPFCSSGSGGLTWTASAGTGPYTIVYTENGGTNRTKTGVVSGTPFTPFTSPVTTTTTYEIVSVTDETTTCVRSSSFTDGDAVITIIDLPQGSLTANGPFCVSGSGQLTWTASAGTGPYTIVYTENGGTNRTAIDVVSATPFTPYTSTVTATTTYVIVSVTDQTTTCVRNSGFTDGNAVITVNPLPQGGLSANGPFCGSGSGQLTWTATAGTGPYTIVYKENGGTDRTATDVVSGTPFAPHTSTVTTTTTYTIVSVTDQTTTCLRNSGFTDGDATITVYDLPQGSLTANGPFCVSGSGQLTWTATAGIGPYTIVYTENGGTNRTAIDVVSATPFTPYTSTVTATTTYEIVSVTDQATTCVRSSSFTDGEAVITVYDSPQGSLTANGPFCVSGSGQLTWTATAGTGPYTIVYTENGGTNRTAIDVVSATPFTPYTSTVTATTTYEIVSVTDQATTCARSSGFTDGNAVITINPLPQGSLSANGPFCDSGPGQLTWTTTAGTGPYTIIYTENGGTNRTASDVVSGIPFTPYTSTVTTTTTYEIVSVTDQTTSCQRTTGFTDGEATITINPLPTLTGASQAADVCSGYAATINLTGLMAGTKSTIYYSIAGVDKTPATNVDADTDPSFETELLNPGDNGKVLRITGIRITDPATMCYQGFSEDLILIVNTANTPSLTGNLSPCVNSTGNVYTTDPGMTNYTWVVSAGGTPTGGGPTDNTVTVTWNTTGSQSVSVNYTNASGCTAASPTQRTVTVNSLPAPTITGPSPVCINSEGNVYTTEANNTAYVWNITGGIITSGSSGNTVVVTWNTSGSQSLSVNYTDANGCTALSSTTEPVTVNSLPVPAVDGPSPVCVNSTGNIYTTQSGMSDYSWSVSEGGTVTAGGTSTSSSVTITWNTSGSKSVSVNYTDPATGCRAASPTVKSVTVNTLPTPALAGPTPVCVNSTGNIYTTEASMNSYVWSVPAGGTITSGGGSTDNTATVTWNSAGSRTISVNYTDGNGCTASAATVKAVTVNSLPVPTITGNGSVCVNSTGNVYTTEYGMTGYSWSVTGGSITDGAGTNSITVTWNSAGAQSVSVNYLNANGCSASSPVVKPVTVNSLPVPTLSGTTSLCAGSTGIIYSTEPAMSGYSWTVSSGGTITSGGGSSDNTVTVTWNTAGARNVTVNYVNPATGCTAPSAAVLPVTVYALPVPTITGPSTPNVNSTGNVYTTEPSMTTYTWTVSAGGTITSGEGTNSINVTWNSSGAQTVSVNYINSNSCTAASPTVYNVIVNALPVASGITIYGDVRSGLTLSASYTYSDADGDLEGSSVYQWYTGTSSSGAGSTPLPSATTTYKLTDAELTKYIGFSVTPVALTGASPGNMATIITWAGPVINDAPVATIQPITGSLDVNGLLTGHYVYSDTEGDIESGTLYQWYSSNSAAGTYTPIAGETSIAHVITDNEQGKYFKIYITPVAASGTTTGTQVQSTAYGPANSQPAASNVQIISGIAAVGSTLEGDYDFSDADPADSEGTSTFRWLRNGTIPVSGATATTYLVTPEDEGYKLSFEVTPVSLTGYPDTGTPVQSALTDVVADTSTLKPVASQVCVEGIRAAGQILRGKYYYDFYKSEGVSTYQWYRNGIPVAGATGIQYTLQQAEDIDSNADITFEVTPRSSNVPEKVGVPVMSNPLARIIMPKDQYSVSENDVTLSANVLGGVFSGTGVTGNIFSPKTAGSDGSPFTISYLMNIVNTAHNCSQQASKLVYVYPNISSFEGLDPVYCHDGGPDMITVTGVPAGSTIIGFTLTDSNGIVSQSGTSVTIDPGRMRPGVDYDILFFSYSFEGTFYQISKSLTIDSVGTEIRLINLESTYCQGDPRKYTSIEGIYPLGGTASWTGDILSDTKTGSAYADPSLGTPGIKYPVSYQYRSPLGCYSKILNDTIIINPLPDPSFALDPTYNIDGGYVTLVPDQQGGAFSGNGVSGDRMFPDIAGLGEHEIEYTITDDNNCTAGLGKKTTIRKAQGSFTGIPAVICYSDTTYRVNVTGLPAGVTVTGFTNTKNTLDYDMGSVYADYNVPAAGEGFDTLRFAYRWDGVDYGISMSLNTDSLGQVTIKNLTRDDLICDNMAPYELFPSILGGTFTGPVSGSYLDPTKGLGPAVVTYIYINFKTGCSISTSIPVIIYPAPKIAFAPADVCIENESDTTFFLNSTTSSDTVQTWLWEFSDAGGTKYSGKENAGYLYTTGGLQNVTLTATTVNQCSSTKESTFNLGVRPDADFYWKSDCMHPGDSLVLRDTTKSPSPVMSRSWRLFNGAEFSTAEKEARYPKTDTGYLKIQYIVRTAYLNCIDTVTKDIYIKPAITIPSDGYFENFGTGSGGWIMGEITGTSWAFGPPAWDNVNVEASGGRSWYTRFAHLDNKVESSSIISPCFDFTETERPLIKLSMMKRFTRDRDGASLQYRVGNSDNWQNVGALDDGIYWYNSPVIRGEPGGNQIGWTTRGEPDTKWVESIHILDELIGKSDVVFRLAYGSDGTSREYEGIALDDIWIGERSRKVLVEHFTNITSKESRDANMIVNEVVNDRLDDIINIQYHTNFPGNDPYYNNNPGDASARILFYGLTSAPYTFIDGGTQKDYAYMYAYTNVDTRIDSNVVTKRSLIPSLFDIALETEVSDGSLVISGSITALDSLNAENMALFLAVVEKKNSQHTGLPGETEFHNVFRKFIPDAGGIILKNRWIKGDNLALGEHVWTIKNIPDSSDIEAIAFIQNTITKEVYQASSISHHQIRVGVEDIPGASDIGFVLYPNPAVNKVTVRFKEPLSYETDIRISDIRGVAVREYKTGRGITEFSIDNLDLKGGIYFVRVSAKGIDLGYRKLVVR